MQTKILAVALIAFSAFIFWNTLTLAPSTFEPLGASAFPRFISVAVALLAAILLFLPSENRAASGAAGATVPAPEDIEDGDDAESARPTPVMAVATVACTILYAAALQVGVVSFGVSTAVFLVVLMSILTRFNLKAIPITLVLAVVFAFGLEYLFTSVFVVNLP